MMNKKAFVLIETIVVIVVLSVALLTIFSSYNKILYKVRTENKYDTSEYIYMTNYIKKYLTKDGCNVEANDIYSLGNVKIVEHYSNNTCGIKDANNIGIRDENNIGIFPIKRIYVLSKINKFDNNIDSLKLNEVDFDNINKNSEIFSANMIDYIRKLDVTDEEKLLIVEYQRLAMDRNYNPISMVTQNNDITDKNLYETYIASLEW